MRQNLIYDCLDCFREVEKMGPRISYILKQLPCSLLDKFWNNTAQKWAT